LACESHTFNATPTEKLQNIPSFLQSTAPIARFFVKVVPSTTFTSWSKHHFVVIGKAEQQVRKASQATKTGFIFPIPFS